MVVILKCKFKNTIVFLNFVFLFLFQKANYETTNHIKIVAVEGQHNA